MGDMVVSTGVCGARILLNGNEAIARACMDARVQLGSGYPGTPSTEVLEEFDRAGGKAQWAPNEKVALEVAIGAAFGNARALAVMKHVGVNVAADPLFSVAYTGVSGALVVVVGDDPGMSSSQNEQDSRHYARAAGLPMLEPADAQEAYDYTLLAYEISHRWHIPVMVRVTTRVCHTSSMVVPLERPLDALIPDFVRDRRGRVLLPGFARAAHQRLREKLEQIATWGETSPLVHQDVGEGLGVVTSGVSYLHVREAAPDAAVLKLGMTHPLPAGVIRAFSANHTRCVVVEEGDPYLLEAVRALGVTVDERPAGTRFGELDVARVRSQLNGQASWPVRAVDESPPELCMKCPHRAAYSMLSLVKDAIITGDIGCYTLGSLAPFHIMDSVVCMGASIGVGLGLRHVLPEAQARRVISVIGDGTFLHSGVTGLMEAVYNQPASGHVVVVLDNGTTAMTGMQPHPGTGKTLDQRSTGRVDYEALGHALGVPDVHVVHTAEDPQAFLKMVNDGLDRNSTTLIVVKNPCGLDKPRDRSPARVIRAGELPRAWTPKGPDLDHRVRNVVFIGRGGQGLMLASTLLAEALAGLGYQVKRSATVGLAQRGGSVRSDLRFGRSVLSPIVPPSQADLVILKDPGRHVAEQGILAPDGLLLTPEDLGARVPGALATVGRAVNVALLGMLSAALDLPEGAFEEPIRHHLRRVNPDANLAAFALGRSAFQP